MGLAEGQTVKTDCSVNWTAPDGKVYCFSTEASKEAFLKNPGENIQKAKEFSGRPSRRRGRRRRRNSPRTTSTRRSKKTIDERSKDGAFVFHDPKLDADLNLLFEQIKVVRGMTGYGWFANVIFHDKDEPKKQYAIDFWFKPDGDKLKLMDIRVQKGPKQEGDSYVHDHAHAGGVVVAAGAGASRRHGGDPRLAGDERDPHLHRHPQGQRTAISTIKDDKTGETVPLEFVEIHQPVRHLKKDGEYFVCTDFRKPGSKDEYYDIDFWVNQKTGKLEVDNVKMHKVPVQEDGIWTQVPRYTFEGMDFDVTN